MLILNYTDSAKLYSDREVYSTASEVITIAKDNREIDTIFDFNQELVLLGFRAVLYSTKDLSHEEVIITIDGDKNNTISFNKKFQLLEEICEEFYQADTFLNMLLFNEPYPNAEK